MVMMIVTLACIIAGSIALGAGLLAVGGALAYALLEFITRRKSRKREKKRNSKSIDNKLHFHILYTHKVWNIITMPISNS